MSSVQTALCEVLEHRRLLHGADGGHDDGHPGGDLDADLVAQVRAKVLTGVDVIEYVGTSYDPHAIGVPTDDERLDGPLASSGTRGVPEVLLPDMLPWEGPSGFNYFHDTQIDTFTLPGRSLLRFSTAIANAGAAPVELRGGPITADGTQTVYQRMYTRNSSGAFVAVGDRTAGEFICHPEHNHMHFEGYAEYRLLQDVGGTAGELALRDDGSTVLGEKVGFCLINITTYDSSIPGYSQSPTGYGCGLRQGISVGRADIYYSGLDSQWIDVTGVAAGSYFLEVTLDANNAIVESDETNNTIRVPVTITNTGSTANGIQRDRFDAIAVNDTFETATDLGSLGDRIETSLTLHATYDTDFFKFTAASGQEIDVALQLNGAGDPNIFLFDQQFNEIDRSTNATGSESVSASLIAGDTYYLKVDNYQYLDELVDNYALVINGPQPIADAEFVGRRKVAEGTSTTVKIHRTEQIMTPLTVPLIFSGTAVFGVDYTVDTMTAFFGAESATGQITINVLADGNKKERDKTIVVTADASDQYVVGKSATVTLLGTYPTLLGVGRVTLGRGGRPRRSLLAESFLQDTGPKSLASLMPGALYEGLFAEELLAYEAVR